MSLLGAMKTCLVLTLMWLCIVSTLNWTVNQLINNNDSFDPTLWRQLKPKFTNSLNVASFEGNSTQTGLLTIVPILKKNRKIRVRTNFRDLNTACPKDEYLLPITDIVIDNKCGFERMSFMDGFSEHNQIKIYLDDKKYVITKTIGVYYYTVMPFGLKNAGATYQHAMSMIFRDHLQKMVECYMLAQRPITLVLMMINSCSYSTNDLVFN